MQVSFRVVVKEDDSKPEAKPEELVRPILTLSHSGMAVWMAVERSAKVVAFHANLQPRQQQQQQQQQQVDVEPEPLMELKVTGVVNKVLAGITYIGNTKTNC